MIKRILGIIVVMAVLGIAANDAYRYVSTQRELNATTYELAKWAGDNASSLTRDQAATQLAGMAAPKGVRVYQYDQGDRGVRVWTATDVTGTVAVGTAAALIAGKSIGEAFGEPFEIRDFSQTNYQ